MPDNEFPPVGSLVLAMRTAPDANGALAAFASALDAGGFRPLQCSLLLWQPDGTFQIEAMWSAVPSMFEIGQAFATTHTPASQRTAEKLLGGSTIAFHAEDEDFGLLSHVIRREGIRTAMLVPLFSEEEVVGLVSVASARDDNFTPLEMTLVTGLIRSTEESILEKLPGGRAAS